MSNTSILQKILYRIDFEKIAGFKKDANVNIQDNKGKTPLNYGIFIGREKVIEILTEKILHLMKN